MQYKPSEVIQAIEHAETLGLKRGLYSRHSARAIALWAGVLAALVGWDSPLWLPVLGLGIWGLYRLRRNAGAWAQEVGTTGGAIVTVILGLSVGALFIGGNVAQRVWQLGWAPAVSGMLVFAVLLTTMEVAHRQAWARIAAVDGG